MKIVIYWGEEFTFGRGGDKNCVGLLYWGGGVFFQVREINKFSAGGGGLLPSHQQGKPW